VLPDTAVLIADRSEAGKILSSPRRRAGIAYLVSIGGTREREPAGFRHAPTRLRLMFEDEPTEAQGGPSRRSAELLIRFARDVDFTKGNVLVQCQAGISRSSAAAIVLLAVALGSDKEAYAVEHVLRVHPRARPNRRLLALADEILGTGGAFIRAWSEASAGR
jgi:predicted protein tyrosine phosphatase